MSMIAHITRQAAGKAGVAAICSATLKRNQAGATANWTSAANSRRAIAAQGTRTNTRQRQD